MSRSCFSPEVCGAALLRFGGLPSSGEIQKEEVREVNCSSLRCADFEFAIAFLLVLLHGPFPVPLTRCGHLGMCWRFCLVEESRPSSPKGLSTSWWAEPAWPRSVPGWRRAECQEGSRRVTWIPCTLFPVFLV